MVYFDNEKQTLLLNTSIIRKPSKNDRFFTNPVYAYLTSSEVFILYETRCPCHSSTFQTDDVECHPLYDSKAYFLSFQQFILKNLFFYLAPRITGNRRLRGAGE